MRHAKAEVRRPVVPARAVSRAVQPALDARTRIASHFEHDFSRVRVHAVPRAAVQLQKAKTPDELAAKSIATGPASVPKEFGKAKALEAKAAKAKTPSTRVAIPTPLNSAGVRTVTDSEFRTQWRACPTARAEGGLPSAFLCATEEITPPQINTVGAIANNVDVKLDGTDKKGTAYVAKAELPWTLDTAGFLNIDVVDPKMLGPYETHERGHRTIAVDVRDRLAKLLQSDLDAALPTKAKPSAYSGATWGQQAVDAIVKKIDTLTQRYRKWYGELADRADAAWDAQEAKTLSAIAAAVKQQQSRTPAVPDVKDEK